MRQLNYPVERTYTMAKEQSSIETVEQIMKDISAKYALKPKKTKKNKKMVETDIDLFATDDTRQNCSVT